jgi:hypothetical protein
LTSACFNNRVHRVLLLVISLDHLKIINLDRARWLRVEIDPIWVKCERLIG